METNYFEWLVGFIDDGRAKKFNDLLYNLYSTRFYWSIRNDDNRETDGINLRYRFVDEEMPFDIENPESIGPLYCTVLEVLVALSIRMENILFDPDCGDQTSKWFWIMIKNLGLDNMSDEAFNADEFDEKMDIFLNRTYGKNGIGGLFSIRNRSINMKKTEIWYQMMHFIEENLEQFDDF